MTALNDSLSKWGSLLEVIEAGALGYLEAAVKATHTEFTCDMVLPDARRIAQAEAI